MCWLTNAWPSTTSVTVFFRSAPTARIGRCDRQTWPRRRAHSRGSGAESPVRTHRRAPPNHPLAAQWVFRRSETRPPFPTGVAARPHLHTRSARWNDWRWSSPGPPARPHRKAGECKRRVGEHHAQFAIAGRLDARESHSGRRDHDWPRRRKQQFLCLGSKARRAPVPPQCSAPSLQTASPCDISGCAKPPRLGHFARRTPGDNRPSL